MRSNTVLTVIFVAIVATVLIGEAYVYTINDGRYSSDVNVNATKDGIVYSVSSKGSDIYSVLVLDNGAFERTETFYIFYDESYGSRLEKVQVPVGAKELTQWYYISQLVLTLNNRGVNNIEILNAADLAAAMASDLAPGGKATAKGLIVLSGALPDTIYRGYASDTVFNWIAAGGSLYWAGNLLGAYYSTPDGGTVPVTEDYQLNFFGRSDCLNKEESGPVLDDITTNDLGRSLSMMNNRTRYGVDLSVGGGLAIGYTDGIYGSAVMVRSGAGMICVLAGDLSNEQRHDLAQIVASGISPDSKNAGYAEGVIKRGTVTGTVDVAFVAGNNYTVYIYCGGYFTVYGKAKVIP